MTIKTLVPPPTNRESSECVCIVTSCDPGLRKMFSAYPVQGQGQQRGQEQVVAVTKFWTSTCSHT
ncbi:hypothetical protein PISMIDRAFT_683730 [Pisolithus microcarpus 441]|uniref:Unplaced genomic scaffold scaffold_111, whole genome shotgun sequence n=1 Tax=Pisolithus microcarpus 441 TaxID=765257 RepID=A0A0C9YQI8_9AGAM|nr:hypothetical protein PISMIDRAFT_690229 [Pisolithus microcarpus 441]KIK12012.1 hypothetical protein PISMIDRAFT_689865 [Pisolithus microcarpus 441]KIK18886.1 hypothetical protein PISMIDRAFT_683730 [Pisolithus microcarpus 441]